MGGFPGTPRAGRPALQQNRTATASIVGAIIGEGPGGIPEGLGRAIINFNQQYSTGPEKLWGTILVSSLLGIAFFLLIVVAERYALRNRPGAAQG